MTSRYITNITGNLTATSFNLLPTGLIVAWNNATIIPAGWQLCDGTKSTPDLRGRFILGAGQNSGTDMNNVALPSQTFGTSGGEVNHLLNIAEMPSHTHGVPISDGTHWDGTLDNISAVATNNGPTLQQVPSNTTGGIPQKTTEPPRTIVTPHNNMPPYYVLVYIMKL